MSNIAFIPARGGSKSIPLKNIKPIAGYPLIYWTAKAAEQANCIDRVVIATDNLEIENTVLAFNFSKLEIYRRMPENAQDTSTTESVMLEYIEARNLFDNDLFFLIQATSPLLNSKHIDEMYSKYLKDNADSAMSGVVTKHFFWTKDGKPLNYDYKNRPRRQDYEGIIQENGACYINSIANIQRDRNRISGKISVYEMPSYTAYEIDEPDDFLIIEKLLERYN